METNEIKNEGEVLETGYKTEVRIMVENYYDVQQLREMAFNRVVNYLKHQKEILDTELEPADEKTAKQIKRILANAAKVKEEDKAESKEGKRKRVPKEYSQIATLIAEGKAKLPRIKNLIDYYNSLKVTEKAQGKALATYPIHNPIRTKINEVKGIGDVLNAGIIAWLEPISRFNSVSGLWSYAGLAPGQKRTRGEKINYNARLKTLCWKIWQQWVKLPNSYGRKLYDEGKKHAAEAHPDWSKLHCHNWAGHRAVKIFIAAVWAEWRRQEHLPVSETYVIAHEEHVDTVTLDEWIAWDKKPKREEV
jgi:transposase